MKKLVSLLILMLSVLLVGCQKKEKPPIIDEKPLFPTTSASIEDYQNDETIYVKLDKTGKVDTMKGVIRLTDVKKNHYITYAGNYAATGHSNLSNILDLEVTNTQVKAPILDDSDNYYFEVALDKSKYELPFDFEFIYKLDDVVTPYESMMNKSGKVTIEIKVTANEQSPYAAQIQIPIDMEHNKILSKAGSSASVLTGKTNTLAYMVMPNESETYEIVLESSKFNLGQIQITLQEFDILSALPFDMTLFEGVSALPQGVSMVKQQIQGLKQFDQMIPPLHQGLIGAFDSINELEGLLQMGQSFNEELVNKLLAPGGITHNENTQAILPYIQSIPPQLLKVQTVISKLGAYIAIHKSQIEAYKATIATYDEAYEKIDNMIVSISAIEEVVSVIAQSMGDIEMVVENKNEIKLALGLLNFSLLALKADNLTLINDFQRYQYEITPLIEHVIELLDLTIEINVELTALNTIFINYLAALKQILPYVLEAEQPLIYQAIGILEGIENDPQNIGLINTIAYALSNIDATEAATAKAGMEKLIAKELAPGEQLGENEVLPRIANPLNSFILLNIGLSLPMQGQTESFYGGIEKLININEFLDLIPNKVILESFISKTNPKPRSIQFVIVY